MNPYLFIATESLERAETAVVRDLVAAEGHSLSLLFDHLVQVLNKLARCPRLLQKEMGR